MRRLIQLEQDGGVPAGVRECMRVNMRENPGGRASAGRKQKTQVMGR